MRCDAVNVIALGAFALAGACSDAPATPGTGHAGSGGYATTSGASGASSSSSASSTSATGAGGAGGDGQMDAAGGGGQGGDPNDASGASDRDAPAADAGADARTEAGSACSPACDPTAPVCDETTHSCKKIEIVALYTQYDLNSDLAHRAWVREANAYFPMVAQANGLDYKPITGWEPLRTITPAPGRVVIFLDNKPTDATLQAAFKAYMDGGGAWMGIHFAAYNGAPSDWDWYFNQFLCSGGYNGNTWRPTSANLKIEDTTHPVAQGLGNMLVAAPNEWYRFKVDLRTVPNIKVLFSIDPSSFPLGTGPKPEEIWHSGDYPVIWTNTKYKMLYVNMGHDDMAYDDGSNRQLSFAFQNMKQDQMLLNALKWLGGVTKTP